jgi:hypothetical protein
MARDEKRELRHSITQEDFTPVSVINTMFMGVDDSVFSDFSIKILDTSSGIGNILIEVLKRRLENTHTETDAIMAVKTLYGVELMADNVKECRENLYNEVIKAYPSIKEHRDNDYALRAIIRNRIQWHDSLTFDYNNWPKIEHLKPSKKREYVSFEERRRDEYTKYPMWYIEPKKEPEQLSLFPDFE